MLIRNVGIHMYTDAVQFDGEDVPEGIVDAAITSLIALHDLNSSAPLRNSRAGSVYIVKPKMHGPAEVAFADELFGRVETLLGMPRAHAQDGHHGRGAAHHRQSEGLHQGRRRPRRLHQHRLPRPHRRRNPHLDGSGPDGAQGRDARSAVDQGLRGLERRYRAGVRLAGKAQIGKGMWAMPDRMADMLAQKIAIPRPAPTPRGCPRPPRRPCMRCTITRSMSLRASANSTSRPRAKLSDILTLPLSRSNWAPDEIQQELDNNCQGILGYVVRWIDQGVGCSKVPDINDVGLMEDRATLRISSQHIANWLLHGIVTKDQVMATLKRMAVGGRPPECRTIRSTADGAGLRRPGLQGRVRSDLQGPRAAQRLHRMDSARAPARGEGHGLVDQNEISVYSAASFTATTRSSLGDRLAAFPFVPGDVEHHAIRTAEFVFRVRAGRHRLMQARRAHGFELLRPFLDVVDHDAEMMDADIVDALAKLVVGEFQDRDVEDAVGQKHAGRPRRFIRLVRDQARSA